MSIYLTITLFVAYDKPFIIRFHTDADEVVSGVTEVLAEHTSTATATPGGIIGFKLYWWQQTC